MNRNIEIADGHDWRFAGGAWTEGDDGELLSAEDGGQTQSLQGVQFAFSRHLCFRDCTVRFQVLVNPHADAGVIFRAADESHFYLVHFPNCAQASRAQHFWVALSKREGQGHLRIIKMAMVRRVPSTPNTWLRGQISVRGAQFQVRLGDYGLFEAEDPTFPQPGYLGLYRFRGRGKAVSWAKYAGQARMRRLEVEGECEAPVAWREEGRPRVPWRHPATGPSPGGPEPARDAREMRRQAAPAAVVRQPTPATRTRHAQPARDVEELPRSREPGTLPVWQQPQDLLCFADGEVLLSYREQWEDRGAGRMIRSRDGGRTWSVPEPLELVRGEAGTPGRLQLTPRGRLIALLPPAAVTGRAEESWRISESRDRGRTWSAPARTGIPREVPGLGRGLHPAPQGLCNLQDGAMLLPLYGGHDSSGPPEVIWTWGSCHCQAFVCRSDDDGRTWSAPVPLDVPGYDAQGNKLPGSLDLTEPSLVQLGSGRVLALIRPVYSPWMWETWSDDGGRSWGPCVRGAFPGYAAPNMVRTVSGALVAAHRLPLLTVHRSPDDGVHWDQGTIIDSGLWAMGAMVEVAPDVVLYAYHDSYEGLMRTQRLRVGERGVLPA